jgi:hypothetical protein
VYNVLEADTRGPSGCKGYRHVVLDFSAANLTSLFVIIKTEILTLEFCLCQVNKVRFLILLIEVHAFVFVLRSLGF